MAEGSKRLYKSMNDYFASHITKPDQPINSTDQSVHRLLGYIANIRDCKIVDVFDVEPSPYIKIHCFTCKALEEFLKLINGNEFHKETVEIRKRLEIQEHIKADDIIVSCSSESIDNAKKRLNKRVPTIDSTCGKHHGTQCTWYCSDHDKYCCSACKVSDHSACVGIKQVVSEKSYGIQKQSLAFKRKIGKYDVRIENRLRNRDDNDVSDCYIRSICMLPNGNILLVDYGNDRLKKLDSSYNVVNYCDLPHIPYVRYIPYDMCYIGDDRAAVCLPERSIQFVNVSGSMKLEQVEKLDNTCYALACHADTLYVRAGDTICTYNRDCQQKHVLYRSEDLKPYTYLNGIAVSDDGERIYIASDTTCLITIDKTGNHLFTLRSDEMKNCRDVCIVGDGTVLVLDGAVRVDQVDFSGERVLGTVVDQSDGLDRPVSLCYDRQKCRIIVAAAGEEYITVFKLKYHSSGAHMNKCLEV